MIMVDVSIDRISIQEPGDLNRPPETLVLFANHRAQNRGAPPGIAPEVQAAALHVAGVLAAAQLAAEKGG